MGGSCLRDINRQDLEIIYVTRLERVVSRFSSRGNQIKWKSNRKFIKLNCLGYENIAEVLASWFLKFTDIGEDAFVRYYPCRIVEDGKYLGLGCYSYDFIGDFEEVTIKDLLNANVMSFAIKYEELRDFLLDEIGIDTKRYLDQILCIDSITRNDDRHFDNIAFLYKDGVYRPAPIFDNGSACMSDTISYPLDVDFEVNFRSIQAKPFKIKFEKQIGLVERILVDCDRFMDSVRFTDPECVRALEVIKRGLKEMEGISWVRN